MRKLTDRRHRRQRAYERERDDFRRHIIELKRTRRVALGPIMTIVFENTDTMRWQVQEMARAERMLRDEQIAHEVETYNQIIPDAGRALGHAAARAHLRRASCASGCRGSSASSATSASCCPTAPSVRGTTSEEDEAAPHPRRHHRGRALLEVRVHARARSRCSRAVRCTSSSTIPSTTTTWRSTEEQHAALLGDLRDRRVA